MALSYVEYKQHLLRLCARSWCTFPSQSYCNSHFANRNAIFILYFANRRKNAIYALNRRKNAIYEFRIANRKKNTICDSNRIFFVILQTRRSLCSLSQVQCEGCSPCVRNVFQVSSLKLRRFLETFSGSFYSRGKSTFYRILVK